jgi:hypothetical protein
MEVQLGSGLEWEALEREAQLPMEAQLGIGLEWEAQLESWLPVGV